ncbi:MAG TPA: aspartyl/asparaginyl beta-hydroxylase domain-containing protein [Solirubrobacteraceae bacterium]|jgi:quercetin dioxygenase-like cupin family protein|nr:aspartyl/asparaginyl beta-hydroxylase domain-containing protein [Solirubrobacteraceae bacterium]
MIVPDRVRLPLSFDAAALASEALALGAEEWVPHFNQDIYEGEWEGVALRSVGGVATQLYPDPAAQAPFADTETLERCPEHRRALDQFRCPLLAARLLALAPGAVINEHRDYRLGWADGEIRVHIAVVTSPDVEFVLDGSRVELPAGQAWYLNLNLPHRVANHSAINRIHLVVDCVVDDWLRGLMADAIQKGSNGVD